MARRATLVAPAPPPGALGPRARVWVAFSGGCDSTALLHLLARAGTPNLRAVHVHHGLQPAAEDWVRHCRRFCRRLGVPLRVLRVRVKPGGEGLEAAARAARYVAFTALLRRGDLLATAHQRDDQAETVLFRALRGTGIAGLAAMNALEPLGKGSLWRPLLTTSRAALLDYAERQRLSWVEDPHNARPDLARAFLRTEVLPTLGVHFPAASESLARLARHARDAARLLATLAELDAVAAARDDALDVPALLALDDARRRNLIYHRWRALGLPPPNEAWYERLEHEVLRARSDALPLLASGDGEARRYRDRLYLMRALPPAPDASLRWGRGPGLKLPPGCGELLRRGAAAKNLEVRFPRGGERLRPEGGAHTRTLKKLCQDAGVPVWVRERMPLLYLDGELIAIGGRWRSARAAALGLVFEWRQDLPGAPS